MSVLLGLVARMVNQVTFDDSGEAQLERSIDAQAGAITMILRKAEVKPSHTRTPHTQHPFCLSCDEEKRTWVGGELAGLGWHDLICHFRRAGDMMFLNIYIIIFLPFLPLGYPPRRAERRKAGGRRRRRRGRRKSAAEHSNVAGQKAAGKVDPVSKLAKGLHVQAPGPKGGGFGRLRARVFERGRQPQAQRPGEVISCCAPTPSPPQVPFAAPNAATHFLAFAAVVHS